MSHPPRSRRPTLHDFRFGELVVLEQPPRPLIVQIVGFRGDAILRLLPAGGMPILASYQHVAHTGLAGSNRPPQRRRRPQRRKPAQQPAAG